MGLRRISGSESDEMNGAGENYIMRSSSICTLHKILSGLSSQGG
jgi:hypothetical protein